VGHRPRHLGPRPGTGRLGADLPRPELGNADVHEEDPELVTSGPYRTIRHPIYTGILLALIGSAIALSVWWLIAVALIGGYFIYSAFVEERNMTRLFPSAYPEYQQSTKMLIPFIF
jgi:protein-S-isoprenylcysteine O-methyltransferase Ste14